MTTTGMNHFTVLTDDVPATVAFYRELLGLTDGPRPPLGFPGAWLYAGEQAVLHVVGGRPRSELKAGVIDHMAFSATGLRATVAMLEAKGVEVPVPAANGHRHLAGVRARPERRAGRARFRARRAGAEMSEAGERQRAASAAPAATLDHLVVAAATLADGIEYIAEVAGVTAQPGGKHVAMGTHNALVRLSDADVPRDHRHRSGRDEAARDRDGSISTTSRCRRSSPNARASSTGSCARPESSSLAAACPIPLGDVHPMARGAYRWRITIPDDGTLPAKGVVPTLIEWDVPQHPAESLPKSNVSIASLAAAHPEPALIRAALASLGQEGVLPVTYDRDARLAAMLRTPRGIVTL